MPRFCFVCEREPAREFVCRGCGAHECADCEPDGRFCSECAFEQESWAELTAVIAPVAARAVGH
jgi:hypothetical protein